MGSGDRATGIYIVVRALSRCHIGMALLTALPVSTGKASTLSCLAYRPADAVEYLAYFLPASVAQQQQSREAGQQMIYNKVSALIPYELGELTAMPTVIRKPMVGPMTLQWQGFWSL